MSKTAATKIFHWTYIPKASKYQFVRKFKDPNGDFHWGFKFTNSTFVECETEREAALRVDKALIGKGKEPVNILKRK